MLISKKNVETNQSLDIGTGDYGHQLKIRADKLVVILPTYKGTAEYDGIAGRLISISQKKWKRYKISLEFKRKEGKSHPYWKALIIRRKLDNKMLLRIDFEPRNKKTGAIRLEFGPQHMTPRELDMLLLWLAAHIGYNVLITLLEDAWVTQVDVALDIYGCRLHDYVWGMKRISKVSGYKKTYGLPGARLGSIRSPLHVLCYEKVDTVGYESKVFREKRGMLDLELGDFPYFLRIEAKKKPGGKPGSKNHNWLMLRDLRCMDYPFERLQVYPENIWHFMEVELSRENSPVRHTIAYYKNYSQKSPEKYWNSRKGKCFLEKREITLFTKVQVWPFWPECVTRLGTILGWGGKS
ncbi:hypothetical protein [Pectobacterium sp. A5351]|uniref:hypothetical protein n=1 Tax=Pectobacterium sp. A5351 TaxID=2914983 RepID=UPI002330A0B3|nr:hypothetical protein [Pectobacterium sp. A5351]WCG82255.1 hypothetical protein O1Q74_15190 [Pectobacterium sp. A5351]